MQKTVAGLQKKEEQKGRKSQAGLPKEKGAATPTENIVESGVPLFLQRLAAAPVQNPEEDKGLVGTPVLPKLIVGPPDDEYEREADRVAETVMGMPEKGSRPIIEKEDGRAEQKNVIQAKGGSAVLQGVGTTPEGSVSLSPQTSRTLLASGGSPLPQQVRSRIESVLGHDLSRVKVHADSHANEAAKSINAKAFTHRDQIYLGKDQRIDDVGLMAHELTHTVQQSGPEPLIRRHEVAPTPVARQNNLALFGNGTPANPGMTLNEFDQYTRRQADWFAETSLSSTDRADLWSLTYRIAEGGHILAGAGDLYISALRTLSAADWSNLSAFGRACHSESDTVRILPASLPGYTLTQRIALGTTLTGLEGIIPAAVLKLTVSETQLLDIQSNNLLLPLSLYWSIFQPHLQETYAPAAGARGPEFQRILDLMQGLGILPFIPLLGRIRNLHRFSVPTLTALMTNFADTSRSRPVHLVLVSGHDAPGAFRSEIPLVEDLVLNSPNLVLVLEGQPSLASITAEIPRIASTYGQPDAGGRFRIGQVMIAGHGETRMIELAGTGAPSVSSTAVTYPTDSLDLDRNDAPAAGSPTTTLIDTLIDNLDPATARIVYTGCLVGSTAVPANTPAASIPGYFNNPANQSLVAYTEARGRARGLSAGFVRGARAATGSATAFRDAAGNLSVQQTFDPAAYGSAVAYVATGHDPIGLFRAAVEVAATAGPLVAEVQLRIRSVRPVTEEWWDESTLSLVAAALHGVGPGSGVDIMRLNALSNLAHIPFLARYNGFGISVSSFVTGVNPQGALAGVIYNQLATRATFNTPPDGDARAMRLMVEQGWLAYGAARTNPVVTFLDATPLLTQDLIYDVLDTFTIASSAPTFFATGAALTPGRIRLALAWLRQDPSNADVRAYLDAQVSVVAGTPTLSAAVRAELSGTNEQDILTLLGRLTATTATVTSTGTTVTLENANAQIGSGPNRVRVQPRPYVATVLAHALNVRRRPSTAGTPFALLRQGESINVMGFTHNWAAIDLNGQLGFVYRSYITSP